MKQYKIPFGIIFTASLLLLICTIYMLVSANYRMLKLASQREVTQIQKLAGSLLANYPELETEFMKNLKFPREEFIPLGKQILDQYGYNAEMMLEENIFYTILFQKQRNIVFTFIAVSIILILTVCIYFIKKKDAEYEMILMILEDYLSENYNIVITKKLLIAEEIMNQYIKETNMTAKLYIYAEADFYDSIKSELKKIEAENIYFRLISYDEEKAIAVSALRLRMMKYPIYLLLLFIGMIGFMNLINTMITSIVTRKKELGILQAIGLSNKQLVKMLQKEGILFTIGTLTCALTFGNLLGYLIFVWGKNTGFMSVTTYHYPFIETIIMISMLVGGQFLIIFFANKNIHKQSLIERMRQQE